MSPHQNDAPPAYHLPDNHPPIEPPRVGVLLINLGTPENTGYRPMRRYLKEFLSDPRVIETNRLFWWLLLNGVILQTRPKRSGRAYAQIWNHERNESPLKTITRTQAEKLAAALGGHPHIRVEWAMRYGLPPIRDKIAALQAQGCTRILLAPLYPQYAAATTATALDKSFDALKAMRWQPAIRTLPPYHDDPAYIGALAQSLENHIAGLGWTPERVIASFHGLPESYLIKGDPYHCHCQKTARLLREALGWDEDRLVITFQSRFGRAEWLKPYTEDTVRKLARDGVNKLVVITPGFAADCVETLEEIAIGVKEVFEENARGPADEVKFSTVPCLNDSPPAIAMLETLVRRELQGWV